MGNSLGCVDACNGPAEGIAVGLEGLGDRPFQLCRGVLQGHLNLDELRQHGVGYFRWAAPN